MLKKTDGKERQGHLKLRQIEVFLEAAKHENFGAASKAIGVSPAYISDAIASLERDLGEGVLLFERDTGGSTLTLAGRFLVERGARLIGEEIATRRDLADLVSAQVGKYRPVKIAYEALVAGVVGNGAYALIHNNDLPVRPLAVDAIETDHETVKRRVQSGEADLGVSYVSEEHDTALDIYPIVTSPLVLIVSNRNRTNYKKKFSLRDLEAERFAMPSRRSTNAGQLQLRELIDDYFLKQDFYPVVSFEGTTVSSVLAMVKTGRMVTMQYTIVLHDDLHVNKDATLHADLQAVPIVPATNREVKLVVMLRKGSRPSFGASNFWNALMLANKFEPLVALPEAEEIKAIPAKGHE
jgi:LysR family cyn operon transcriptional activator